MKKEIYRKESLDNNSGVDKLDEYTRVNKPSLFIILGAIVALLIGFAVWGIFGTIESKVETYFFVESNVATSYLSSSDFEKVKTEMNVEANSTSGTITSIDSTPIIIDEKFDTEKLYYLNFKQGDYCFKIESKFENLADGSYSGKIIVEKVNPISFLFN